MKVSYKQLQTYFTGSLPAPEVLAEAISLHFAEVESIEKEGSDSILDVKVLPDRAGYAKSYEGIALEVSAILGITRKNIPSTASFSKKIPVTVEQINHSLGTEIPEKEIISILKKLDIGVEGKGGELILAIPENRADLTTWRDMPEEVARIWGYEKITPIIPKKEATKLAIDKTFYYSEKIKNTLKDMGFSEVYLYSLVSKGDMEIEKSVATDKNFLRTNLTEGVVKSLEFNARNADLLGLDTIQIFEIGKIFPKTGERTSLCIGIKNAKKKQERVNDKIKTVRDDLMKALGAEIAVLCTVDDTGGIISLKGKPIGMTNNTDGILELDLDSLIAALPEPKSYADLHFKKAAQVEYKKFSQYPFIARDIAVFVPESVSSEDVWKIIKKGVVDAQGMELLAHSSLFDTFEKDGKVSYAFRMIFQSMERTLTDTETNAIMEKVAAEVKSKGWEVR